MEPRKTDIVFTKPKPTSRKTDNVDTKPTQEPPHITPHRFEPIIVDNVEKI